MPGLVPGLSFEHQDLESTYRWLTVQTYYVKKTAKHKGRFSHYVDIRGWRYGLVVTRWLRSYCATSDPVSTRMGDRLWTGKLFRYVTSQLGQLSLSSLWGQ